MHAIITLHAHVFMYVNVCACSRAFVYVYVCVCIHILYIIIHAWLILALGEFLCSLFSCSFPSLFSCFPFSTSESRKNIVWTLSIDMTILSAKRRSHPNRERTEGRRDTTRRLQDIYKRKSMVFFFSFAGSNSSVSIETRTLTSSSPRLFLIPLCSTLILLSTVLDFAISQHPTRT